MQKLWTPSLLKIDPRNIEDDAVFTEESPEIDDDDIEENEFETHSEDETDGQ